MLLKTIKSQKQCNNNNFVCNKPLKVHILLLWSFFYRYIFVVITWSAPDRCCQQQFKLGCWALARYTAALLVLNLSNAIEKPTGEQLSAVLEWTCRMCCRGANHLDLSQPETSLWLPCTAHFLRLWFCTLQLWWATRLYNYTYNKHCRRKHLAASYTTLFPQYVLYVDVLCFVCTAFPLCTRWTACLLFLHVCPSRIANDWWVLRMIACDS